MTDFVFQEMFPLGKDTTPYRKLTGDFVDTASFEGETLLKIDSEAMTLLAFSLVTRASRISSSVDSVVTAWEMRVPLTVISNTSPRSTVPDSVRVET